MDAITFLLVLSGILLGVLVDRVFLAAPKLKKVPKPIVVTTTIPVHDHMKLHEDLEYEIARKEALLLLLLQLQDHVHWRVVASPTGSLGYLTGTLLIHPGNKQEGQP